MTFSVPTALYGLLLTVPVIALYIMRVRLRRVSVSTGFFWSQIYEEKPPRSLWQTLRHLVSLLLQLLLLLLLIVAVADPILPWQLTQARRVVLVVDASASMQAGDLPPTRFDAAVSEAQLFIDGLRSRDEMAVVLAGVRPVVAAGMSSHVPTLRRAVEDLEVQAGPADLQAAIQLARQLIGEHPAGRIAVLTDGCDQAAADLEISGAELTEPTGERSLSEPVVEYHLSGTQASNVGITLFQARRSLTDPAGYEVLIHVRNLSAEAVRCRLELDLDGLPVDVFPLTLQPDDVWLRAVEKTSLAGGMLSGRLTGILPADGPLPEEAETESTSPALNRLAVDDTAWAVLPAREVQKVLIMTPGNLFLQKVFEASPLADVDVLHELPETWPSADLTVLHQLVPDQLPPGNVLVVDPAEDSALWTLGEAAAGSIVTEQDSASRLMTNVHLDSVVMSSMRPVAPTGPTRVLAADVSGRPVYMELMRGQGRCLLLNSGLENSDLAFRTTFPILISNALTWFSETAGQQQPALVTGDVTTVQLSQPASNGDTDRAYVLIRPDGARTELAVMTDDDAPGVRSPQRMMVGPLTQTGVYLIAATPADGAARGRAPSEDIPLMTLAASLSSERESDLRPMVEADEPDSVQTAGVSWFSRPMWFYLALLAGGLTMTEWFLYHRRLTD